MERAAFSEKPSEEPENKENRNFCEYANTLCSRSLITSFSQIAGRKCCVGRWIKIIIFIFCLIGFIYQTLSFVSLYSSYQTEVHVNIYKPSHVVQPAITVCNSNRYRRSVYCEAQRDKCTFQSPAEFCATYPRMCKSEEDAYAGMPDASNILSSPPLWNSAFNYSHTSNIIASCEKVNDFEKKPCDDDYRVVPVVSDEDQPNLCYAIESLSGKPDMDAPTVPNRFTFRLVLNTEPEEYAIATDPVKMYIAVDDRRKLVNPYKEGYALYGGKIYNIYVSVIEYLLLPPPYDTDCVDYMILWIMSNGTGPLNRKMCIERCRLDALLRRKGCIDPKIQYPHTETLCRSSEDSVMTGDMMRRCSVQCQDACFETEYDLRLEEVGNFDASCSNEWCKMSKIKVNIIFEKYRKTQIVHVPLFQAVDTFFYVGCYMVIWLGVSFVSLFDLIETILGLLCYPLTRRKMSRKTDFYENERIKDF